MLYTRDIWLHALTLPYALIQQLFVPEATKTARTSYYLPAERSPHLGTLMSWPDDTFSDNIVDLLLARQEIASIANTIATYEPVWMHATKCNADNAGLYVNEGVMIISIDVEQPWIRDVGPILVTESSNHNRLIGIDFNFDYWGDNVAGIDRTFAQRALRQTNLERIAASMVTEGSALEVDGEGTLLVTESSLLNSNRNEDRDKGGMEDTFHELLGIQKTIWLQGAAGVDATDFQIDRLARFSPNSSTILLSRPQDSVPRTDPAFIAYAQAHLILSTSTNAAGVSFNIVEIEEAAAVAQMEDDGTVQSAPMASYLSFYLVNGAVILPQFGDERTDKLAIETMQELFADRVVELVMLHWMPWAGHGLHSATLQWPSTK